MRRDGMKKIDIQKDRFHIVSHWIHEKRRRRRIWTAYSMRCTYIKSEENGMEKKREIRRRSKINNSFDARRRPLASQVRVR